MSNARRLRRSARLAGPGWSGPRPSRAARTLLAREPALPPGVWHVDDAHAAALGTGTAAVAAATHAASGHRFLVARLPDGRIVALAGATPAASTFLAGQLAAGVVTAWAERQDWWIVPAGGREYSAPDRAGGPGA